MCLNLIVFSRCCTDNAIYILLLSKHCEVHEIMIKKLQSRLANNLNKLTFRAPTRPIVLIQSDDWGRVGVPDITALDWLRKAGYLSEYSAWDSYGLESGEDLTRLGETLSQNIDVDGNPACITANIIMANADLRKMSDEGFSEFRFVPISDGFPAPWGNFDVLSAYKRLISMGVFYPALHGFTHFSPKRLLAGWHDRSQFGDRVRMLVSNDIPYLASVTPEFNFALLQRFGGYEKFANYTDQRDWIESGVQIFEQCFGIKPLSTCAPGYRSNDLTHELWAEQRIKVVQTASGCVPYHNRELLYIPRTVFFEPVLDRRNLNVVVADALQQAQNAVKQGKMIVICSHSINYIQRHCGRREECLDALNLLLAGLLKMYPDLRFANDQKFFESLSMDDRSWFKYPSMSVSLQRYQ